MYVFVIQNRAPPLYLPHPRPVEFLQSNCNALAMYTQSSERFFSVNFKLTFVKMEFFCPKKSSPTEDRK